MRTRSSSNLPVVSPSNPSTSNPKRHNRRRSKQPFILEESPIDTMADQLTMAELLRAPIEGYAEAIVVPLILAEQFELKHSLINMITSDQFFGLEKDNYHDHIRWFNKITSTIKYKYVPNSAIKLMLFPFSLAETARRATILRNEISNFQQRFDESFHEAWDRYKDLLRACPHHGFTELHQLDTFYNDLNLADQDSLNAAAGGNLLERQIAKLTHAVNQQTSAITTAMTAILKQFQATPPPAFVKAVAEVCVTCGGAHPYYQIIPFIVLQVLANQIQPLGFAQPNVQNNQNQFGQPQGFNRGNNFNHEQSYQASTKQNQIIPLNELEKVKRINEANIKAMQTQINIVKNELRNEMENSIQASLSNQTNEIKNMMASLFQMNTASTSGSGSLHSNTVANSKGEIKAITTRSGLLLDGPTVLTPPTFINPKEDECIEETLTDPDLSEYTIRSHHLLSKNTSLRLKEIMLYIKRILFIRISLTHQGCSNKNSKKKDKSKSINVGICSSSFIGYPEEVTQKLGDPGKFLILCGFSELKCKALANLGASINLMPLFIWKKLGLPELISTRITLELANRTICTPAGVARDVFVPVGKFTFLADFVIVDYESDPRVPLILGRPFLRTARALIDVHGEEMILRDGDKRLTLNMRHDTSSYSNQPQKELISLINVFKNSSEDFLEDLFSNQPSGNPIFSSHRELTSPEVKNDIFNPEGGYVLPEKLLYLDSTKDLHPPLHVNPLSGSTTYSSSPNPLLEELADELALITFPLKYDDDLQFDVDNLANPADNFVDSMPEMFTDEHTPDYSSSPIFDEYDDDFLEVESETENVYDDPFDSKGEKIKESKLLIEELDLPCDFLPSEYDSFTSEDFSKVDAKPSTNNEGKVFNPGILIQENPFEIITRVVQDKKLATSNAFLVPEDCDPPLYEPLFFKEVSRSNMLLLFSSENEEKVFKLGIHTSKKVHYSRIPELSHQGYKVFKINQIFKIPMKIFLFSCGKDTYILVVPCLHFYPIDQSNIPGNLMTNTEGFCPPVFISSASLGNHPRCNNNPRKLWCCSGFIDSSGLLLRQKPSMEKDRYMSRFIQVFLDKQLEGLSNHERKYVAPFHIKKIFRNMRRVGKDKAVYKEMDDSLVRAATTASSLEAKQDSGNINKTQSKATPNESSSKGTDSGGDPRCQDTMRDTIDHTRSERVSKFSNDSLLARDLVEDASKWGRKIHDIDANEDITLVNNQDDEQMFDADQYLRGEEVFVPKQDKNVVKKEVDAAQVQVSTAATTATISIDEHNSLKNKSFTNIQELFDKAMKRVNTFVDYRTELVEESSKKAEAKVMKGSSKRASTELEQDSSKKIKIDDDKETTKLKQLVKIIPDEEEVEIDVIPLAVKPLSIVDWKIHKEEKKREDVKTLWKLVKAKHGSKRLEEDYEKVLWGDLKSTLLESAIWTYLHVG
uniref:DNA-directed DNA polymerase n=1 Tax=Tanacetum cinerariifolium TaxID=118510 RepID=A0A6L2KGZ9_TANCI|nr:DNA-directed DNA polymerase [Tanacetum cinerariifolium]